MHVSWPDESYAAVVMLGVVPVDEVPDPVPGVLDAAEPFRVVAVVFHGFELGFTVRIIVTHPRPGVAFPDAEDTKEFNHAASHHGTTPVRVQGELIRADVATGAGSLDKFSGYRFALLISHSPANHTASEDIEDGVEVVENAFAWTAKFGYIPTPALIRAGRFQPGNGMQTAT